MVAGLRTVPPRSTVPTKRCTTHQEHKMMSLLSDYVPTPGLVGVDCCAICLVYMYIQGMACSTTCHHQGADAIPSGKAGGAGPLTHTHAAWVGWLRNLLTVKHGALVDRVTISWVSTINSPYVSDWNV